MRTIFTFALLLLFHIFLNAQNSPPNIIDFKTRYSIDNSFIRFFLDVEDKESDTLDIDIKLSTDYGLHYQNIMTFSNYIIGKSNIPVWVLPDSLHKYNPTDLKYKVTVSDRQKIDIQSILNQVDTNRLRNELLFIQGIRHRTAGKVHLAEVQDSIIRQFNNLKLDTSIQHFTYSGYDAKNIIASTNTIGNEDSLYILCAHYDSVNNAPGADDNGSGVVGMNEVARILAPYSFNKKLKFIGFDLEEAGLIGSSKFITAKGVSPNEKLLGTLDYEMIGFYSEQPNSQLFPTGFNLLFPAAYAQSQQDNFRGNFITNVANVASDSLRRKFDKAASSYVPNMKVISIAVPGTGTIAPDLRRSDHAPFWDAGYPALMLTDGANFRNLNYHTAKDSINQLNFTFMGNVVKATIAMLAEAAGIEHSATKISYGLLDVANNFVNDNNYIQIFPNPANSILNIQVENEKLENGNLQIIDMSGKLVLSDKINGKYMTINTLSLPNGTYQLIVEKNGNKSIKTFVKE